MFISLLILTIVSSCHDETKSQYARNQFASNEVIDINDVQVHIPEGPGFDALKAACITCHSLRYIEMQPDFPKKTWETIVSKMVKNFGAPIPDSTASEIVEYLVKIKGDDIREN
jgi:hypothetical protein